LHCYRVKKETEKQYLLNLLRNWCSFWSPKIIKDEFDAAVVSAINKVFPDSVITGCNIHFSQCLKRERHIIDLTVEYKENEEFQHNCIMCAVLECLPIIQVEEDLLTIMQMFDKTRN
jgi:hypothetical protein